MTGSRWSCAVGGCAMPSMRTAATRFNRLLAWLLFCMPWIHIAVGTPFWLGLGYDLVVLAVHGVLSLMLFGLPKARTDDWLLWLGIAPKGMTPRNAFLLTGWGIALTFLYLVLVVAVWGTSLSFLGVLGLVLGLQLPFLWITLPFRVVSHVYRAVEYAAMRRRLGGGPSRKTSAQAFAIAYVVGHFVNLVT